MKESYLEVTYRHGEPLAAYLYLPYDGPRKARRSRRVGFDLVIDLSADGRPVGIEITAPRQVTVRALNRVLRGLRCAPVHGADLAPLQAALKRRSHAT